MCNPITTARPESLLAKGKESGFEWEVTHNMRAYRCGYVKVLPGHPWFGKRWDEVDVDCHGGVTFAEADTHCGKGGVDDGWWIGFDCAHGCDKADPELPGYEDLPDFSFFDARVRSQGFVEDQCRSMCQQAHAAAITNQ